MSSERSRPDLRGVSFGSPAAIVTSMALIVIIICKALGTLIRTMIG